MIELRVLGTLDLRDSSTNSSVKSVLAQPKRMALLSYLAVATPRGPHRREKLLSLFWPDSSEDRARNSLNQTVFNLRRSLGETAILATGEDIQLVADVRCDAVRFEEALSAGEVQRALSLYAGELLPAFHVDGCAEFEHWLDMERERLRRTAVAAALTLADEQEQTGNRVGAVELLRRVVTWTPYDEPAVKRLITLLAHLGDRAGALQEFESFRGLLETDLELVPSAELQTLAQEIRITETAPTPPLMSVGAPERPVEPTPAPDRLVEPTAAPERPVEPTAAPRNRLHWLAAAALAVLAIIAAARFFVPSDGRNSVQAAPPLDAHRVLVAAFENRTGDASLEPLRYMAADWIAQGLAQTGVAHAVPFSTVVQETPHLTAEGVAPEVAVPAANRQFARRIGAGTLVTGSYYSIGNEIVFQAQIIDVATGELLRALDEVRGSAERPGFAVKDLQRRSLGALATLFDKRLESWPDPGGQPSSLEAYQLFSEGMGVFMSAMNFPYQSPEATRTYAAAAEKFIAAAALDSMFIHALLWARYGYLNAGDSAGVHSVRRTLERRQLSRWSKAVLNHQSAFFAHDREAAYRSARELAELSPDSEWLLKLGQSAFATGRLREALDAYRRMDPDRGWTKGWVGYWGLRAEVQHMLGNYEAALEDTRRGLTAHPDNTWVRTQELWALAALGRADDIMQRLGSRLAASEPMAIFDLAATVKELRGHSRNAAAERVLREAMPLAKGLVAREGKRAPRGDLAYLLYLAGRTGEAADLYRTLAAEHPEAATPRVRLALLAARQGDRRPAAEVSSWLGTLHGDGLARALSSRQLGYWGSYEGWRTLLQARLAVQLGEHERAVELLREAVHQGLQHTYMHLHDDPDFDVLRKHAGFKSLLRSRD